MMRKSVQLDLLMKEQVGLLELIRFWGEILPNYDTFVIS